MSLSIIIPTYKNTEFLKELIDSINQNQYNNDFEVLIGIDSCRETLNYVYNFEYPNNFKFYFFLENKGPYLIKNTLAELSKYDNLLFFDSDDIMLSNMLFEIDDNLDYYDVVKPKYMNFTDNENGRNYDVKLNEFGEGVFGIKKEIFLSMNGFEGWKVAADSDFMGRLYKTNVKILHTKSVLFHRRKHNNSLTIHPDTGMSSRLRGKYYLLSRKKTSENIKNEVLRKNIYNIVDLKCKELLDEVIGEIDVDIKNNETKVQKREELFKILTSKSKDIKIDNKPKQIDYHSINIRSNQNQTSQLKTALKKINIEQIKKNIRR